MIGELLAHLLIGYIYNHLSPVSPYFNQEERSIKKGFDINLYDFNTDELWIAEIKSGAVNKGQTSDEKKLGLIGEAKRDLKGRLNSSNAMLWRNALTGVRISLNESEKTEFIKSILSKNLAKAEKSEAMGVNHNVILISNIFNSLDDRISLESSMNLMKKIRGEKIFNKVMIFSIQKKAYLTIVDFLRQESSII